LVWRIELTDSAVKQLSKLGKVDAKRITTFLRERVVDDPRASGKALTGPLGGLRRCRVGDYRIVCELQDAVLRVLVVRIANRREVYR
jgi:mRNA interferase RelE/StbE